MDVVKSLKSGRDDAKRHISPPIELIVERKSKPSKIRAQRRLTKQAVAVIARINFHEKDLQLAVKQAGEKWQPEKKARLLAYKAVVQLGLQERIIHS